MHPAMACLVKAIRCCLDCCHRFIKYVNKTAYCQVALTGENFCTAAINGFLLILKHSMTFTFTAGIGGVFNLLGKFCVCILNMVAGFFVLQYAPTLHGKISSPIGPLAVVFLISFCISSLFMSMYSTTTVAILHCLFADIDICKTMGYDEMQGQNRPAEMKSVVKVLTKIKKGTKSSVNENNAT